MSVDHQDWLSRKGPLRGHSSQLKSFQFAPYINSFRPPHYWLIIINYSTDWSPKAAAQLFMHHLFNSNLCLLHLVAIIMPLYSWLSELETSEHWANQGSVIPAISSHSSTTAWPDRMQVTRSWRRSLTLTVYIDYI